MRMVDEQEGCEWMNVSSGTGTGSPRQTRTKARKTVVCVCVCNKWQGTQNCILLYTNAEDLKTTM